MGSIEISKLFLCDLIHFYSEFQPYNTARCILKSLGHFTASAWLVQNNVTDSERIYFDIVVK